MKKAMLLALGLAFCATSGACAGPMQLVRLRPMAVVIIPTRATPLYAKYSARLTPDGRAFVAAQSARLRNGSLGPSQVEGLAAQSCGMALAGCNGGADIEALAFLVLMQATDDQDQDLKAIMAQIQAQTNAQAGLRQTMPTTNAVSAEQINQEARNLQGDLDSMNEMSEMTSMRLQMAMDRRSQFVQSLTNVLKKIDDTQSAITQNLK
jgi:hypothetical protein